MNSQLQDLLLLNNIKVELNIKQLNSKLDNLAKEHNSLNLALEHLEYKIVIPWEWVKKEKQELQAN